MSNPFNGVTGRTFPTSVVIALIGFGTVVALGVIGLVALGKDITSVVYFLGGFVPVILGLSGLVSTQEKVLAKTDQQSAALDQIKKSVNGQLDAKFDKVHEAIVENGVNAPATEGESTNG